MEVLRVQNNSKNLDTSSQMDLDLWDALEGKINLISEMNKTKIHIFSILI